MGLLEWREEFSVGVQKIDEQHKQLVVMLNNLHSAMKQGEGNEALNRILSEMASYAVEHFQTEEELFRSYSYPEYLQHKQEHDDFVARVTEFKKQFDDKKMLLSLAVSEFLRDWLLNHIMKTDKKYTEFMHQKGVY